MEKEKLVNSLTRVALGALGLSLSFLPDSHSSIPPTLTAPTYQARSLDNLLPEGSSVFDVLMKPFVKKAFERRTERADNDPEYGKRIDSELNQNRINFTLFGYGETHEPPFTEKAFIGSITILSFDTLTRQIDLVSLTHDIRAPEVERYQLEKDNFEGYPIKIDQAYPVGGFPLLRKTLEDATGLSIDFQIAFHDRVIVDLTDNLLGNIEVDVPISFAVYPFYLEGRKHEGGYFSEGRQKMDGLTLLQFIKTVPVEGQDIKYNPLLEHNSRKHLVMKALVDSFKANIANPLFLRRAVNSLLREAEDVPYLDLDFKLKSILRDRLIDHIISLPALVSGMFFHSGQIFPEVNHGIYIVDSVHGDGGVQWVKANKEHNPYTKREWAAGIYHDEAFEIPYTPSSEFKANPNEEDLITYYWPPVRGTIKKLLIGTNN